ncbi:MAG: hypothetical protein JXK94_06315 [Deltaproteobacteria bacterium]|nr:hypothetical protein [Deltaproteobacteria bacterium]
MNPSGRYNTTQSTENQHKPVFHWEVRVIWALFADYRTRGIEGVETGAGVHDCFFRKKIEIIQLIGAMPRIAHSKGRVNPSMGLCCRHPGGRCPFHGRHKSLC